MSHYQPTVPAEQVQRRSAVYERAVRATAPRTVQELVWLHADLRMADVPEAARLTWGLVEDPFQSKSAIVEASWEVDASDARPV